MWSIFSFFVHDPAQILSPWTTPQPVWDASTNIWYVVVAFTKDFTCSNNFWALLELLLELVDDRMEPSKTLLNPEKLSSESLADLEILL